MIGTLWHPLWGGSRPLERNPAEVERLVSDLIELSTRQNFARWLAGAEILAVGRGALRAIQQRVSGSRTE